MAEMGRPKIKIDRRQFELLCSLQATEEEICAVLGGEKGPISPKTLTRWCRETYKDEKGKGLTFYQVFKQKRLEGRTSLRRAQFLLARKSPAMAIFLGKNWLGQKDVVETTGEIDVAVKIVDDVPDEDIGSSADEY